MCQLCRFGQRVAARSPAVLPPINLSGGSLLAQVQAVNSPPAPPLTMPSSSVRNVNLNNQPRKVNLKSQP